MSHMSCMKTLHFQYYLKLPVTVSEEKKDSHLFTKIIAK